MSDQDNTTIFNETENQTALASDDKPAASVQPTTPTTPTIPEGLEELVGDGKKYSSLEDALKSIPHAQQHIARLEEENRLYKENLEKAKSMEDILEQMKSQQPKGDQTGQQVGEDADDLLSKLSSQLDSLLEQKLSLKQQETVHKQNAQTVTSAFKEAYGDKAEEVYKGLSEETGMSVEALNQMAATSPKALLKLAGLSGKTGTTSPKPQSSFNTEALMANAQGQKPAVKPVMFGATSAQVLEAWRASKPV
jgi:hypothetical protein